MAKDNLLTIRTLGPFNIERGNDNLTYKYRLSKKPVQLLKYLLASRNRTIGKDRLVQLLSSEDYYGDASQQINNLVYRLRKIVDSTGEVSNIIFENDRYRWNSTPDSRLDLDQVDELFSAFNKILDNEPYAEAQILSFGSKIINYYDDVFMPDCDEDWVMSTRRHYLEIYSRVVLRMIKVHSLNSDYKSVLALCSRSMALDAHDINIHAKYMNALIQLEETRKALDHYEYITASMYKESGMNPPAIMLSMYNTIKKNKDSRQFLFSEISKELVDKMKTSGALLCDSDVFSFLYNIEKNRERRFDQSIYLALITFVHSQGDFPSKELLNKETSHFQEILLESLRSTDIVSKWSQSQFVVMLYRTSSDYMDTIFNRLMGQYAPLNKDFHIVKNFRKI